MELELGSLVIVKNKSGVVVRLSAKMALVKFVDGTAISFNKKYLKVIG